MRNAIKAQVIMHDSYDTNDYNADDNRVLRKLFLLYLNIFNFKLHRLSSYLARSSIRFVFNIYPFKNKYYDGTKSSFSFLLRRDKAYF